MPAFPPTDDPLVLALQQLLAREGGAGKVAAEANLNSGSVYQVAWLKPNSKTKKLKSVGPKMRRNLTDAFPDWLKAPAESAAAAPAQESVFGRSPKQDRRVHDPEEMLNCVDGMLARIPKNLRRSARDMLISYLRDEASQQEVLDLFHALAIQQVVPNPPKRVGGG